MLAGLGVDLLAIKRLFASESMPLSGEWCKSVSPMLKINLHFLGNSSLIMNGTVGN
jgi:hypothetical protein